MCHMASSTRQWLELLQPNLLKINIPTIWVCQSVVLIPHKDPEIPHQGKFSTPSWKPPWWHKQPYFCHMIIISQHLRTFLLWSRDHHKMPWSAAHMCHSCISSIEYSISYWSARGEKRHTSVHMVRELMMNSLSSSFLIHRRSRFTLAMATCLDDSGLNTAYSSNPDVICIHR